jgi:hypothetical protein
MQTHRQHIAAVAAKLMVEHGIQDIQRAKQKAAQQLGLHDDALLPAHHEVEEALRQHQRLFRGEKQQTSLRALREAALHAMAFFQRFHPRLAGAVLDGTADTYSTVQLHVHSDDSDAVLHWLNEHGIPYQQRNRRIWLSRQQAWDAPVCQFTAEDVSFDVFILPLTCLHQGLYVPAEDKPMLRISAEKLKALLDQP